MSDTSPVEEAFQQRVLEHLGGAYLVAMCYLGDRLGLFRSLADHGPGTSQMLAERLGLRERYVREWLYALASAAYLTYDADADAFALPPGHRAILAAAEDARFLGGLVSITRRANAGCRSRGRRLSLWRGRVAVPV